MAKKLTLQQYAVLGMVMLTAAVGDTLLSHGMSQVGTVHLDNLALLIRALANPWVLGGVCCLIGFFASYLTALSWADLTFVLPTTSFSYVIVAMLSRFWLHETISPARWAGIALIVGGVGFVANGPALTQPPMPAEAPKS